MNTSNDHLYLFRTTMSDICTDEKILKQFEDILRQQTNGRYEIHSIENITSAQQTVLLLTLTQKNRESPTPSSSESLSDIEEEIRSIRGEQLRLILRIWKAGARWWNLNCNSKDGLIRLANSEVFGYQLAYQAFEQYYNQYESKDRPAVQICIPKLLYYQNDCQDAPWAVFSFVKDMELAQHYCDNDLRKDLYFDNKLITDMVKVRKEFGFDEAHPRHGRVAIEDALDYAMQVLETAIFPLHTIFYQSCDISKQNESFKRRIKMLNANNFIGSNAPIRYIDMVELYQEKLSEISSHMDIDSSLKQDEITSMIKTLQSFVQRLLVESKKVEKFPLPSVLCHLDLQPQNMILLSNERHCKKIPQIFSILDWEESCFADPRFELLLICRKVVANRQQADCIWKSYGKFINDYFHLEIGSLDSWLRLESVHSLLGMCMQSMDLLEGGRNPWEEKPDLVAKLKRELHRLEIDLGWDSNEDTRI